MNSPQTAAAPHPLALFRFCPRCGSAQFRVHDARSKTCGDCGFTFYHNSAAAAAAVIINEREELLVVRRANEPARGTLDLPGGFLEPGERAEEGVAREVEEETGGKAVADHLLLTLPNKYEYSGYTVDTTDLFYACHLITSDALRPADDAAEVFWLPLTGIKPADFGLASIRRAVEHVLSLRNIPF